MTTPMIHVRGLQKRFGYRWVLRRLDWTVEPGQVIVLLGPNGAGKTTLLRVLATLTRFQGGRVQVAGAQLPKEATQARRRIGYLGHATFLYPDLSAEQNLRFYARLYQVPDPEARIHALLEQVGLLARRRDPVRTFSRGMQQRLALARVLLIEPPLLLFDEPFTGLDQEGAATLTDILHQLVAQGRTLVLTSHDFPRVLPLATRFDLLHRGRITASLDNQGLTIQALQDWYDTHVATSTPEVTA